MIKYQYHHSCDNISVQYNNIVLQCYYEIHIIKVFIKTINFFVIERNNMINKKPIETLQEKK